MPWNTNDAERPTAWWPGTQCVRCAYLRVDVCLVLDEGADHVDETTRRRLPAGKRWRQFGVDLVPIWQPSNCSLSQNHVRPKRKRRDTIRSGQDLVQASNTLIVLRARTRARTRANRGQISRTNAGRLRTSMRAVPAQLFCVLALEGTNDEPSASTGPADNQTEDFGQQTIS